MNQDQRWFYLDGARSIGPVTEEQLVGLWVNGQISRETLVWQQGRTNWMALREALPALAASPPPLPFETQSDGSKPAPGAPPISAQQPAPQQPTTYATARRWTDTTPHPWRRYLARTVDSSLNGAALWAVFGFVLYAIDYDTAQRLFSGLAEPTNRFLNTILTVIAAVPGNALLIGLTGGSVGKWLFGVRILDTDGNPIGFVQALKREGAVLVRGLGFGIPIVVFF